MSGDKRASPGKSSPAAHQQPTPNGVEVNGSPETPTGVRVPDVTGMSVLDAALAYAEAGLYVGPLKHRTKHPGSVLGGDWPVRTSRDPDVIRRWFRPDTKRGVFLHCGRSGLLVFDVDTPENLHEFIDLAVFNEAPPWQNTRPAHPDRRHYLFAMPPGRTLGNSTGTLGKGWGEVRGKNGVIVVAPSEHEEPDGRYTWGHVGPVPVLPAYLADELPDAMPTASAVTDAEVEAFIAEHDSGDRSSRPGEHHWQMWHSKVEQGESRHASMTGHLAGALKEAAAGLYPARPAVEGLEKAWLSRILEDGDSPNQSAGRTPEEAAEEWNGLLKWAVAQAKAADPAETLARVEEYGSAAEDDFAEPLEDVPERLSDGRDWFINTVMPTKAYGLLSGPIGAGKSSVVGYVVSLLTKDGFRVRYCVEDEPEVSARHRLELMGADLDLVTFDTVPDLTTLAKMERYARSCAADGTDLMVLDLLHTANSGYEENRPENVKQWTGRLVDKFCRKYGVGVLGTHHWNNNSKAGSEMARLSGAGAIAAKTEFIWSVAISNDKTEQVWSVQARRRCSAWNIETQGTRHVVEVLQNPFDPTETVERDVYTVEYGDLTERTSFDVARDAEREFASGGKKQSSRELVPADAVWRFLDKDASDKFPGKHRKRVEVEEFLYWITGEEYSPQTVVDRLRDAGAVQCSPDGEVVEDGKGRYWIVPSVGSEFA